MSTGLGLDQLSPHPPSDPGRPSLVAEITAEQRGRRHPLCLPLSLPAVGPWEGPFSELQLPSPQKWSDNTHVQKRFVNNECYTNGMYYFYGPFSSSSSVEE